MKLELELDSESLQGYQQLSQSCGIELSRLLEQILIHFLRAGGQVYVGEWEQGIRLVIAWPMREGYTIVKLKL